MCFAGLMMEAPLGLSRGPGENPLNESIEPRPGMANPAALKCLADGYELIAEAIGGVPRGHLCVDRRSRKSCGIWPYFRGECDLPPPAGRGDAEGVAPSSKEDRPGGITRVTRVRRNSDRRLRHFGGH